METWFLKTSRLKLLALILLVLLVALPRVLPFPAAFTSYDETKIGAWVSEMALALSEGNWTGTAISNNPYPVVTLAWLELLQAKTMPHLPGWTGQSQAQMLSTAAADVFAALPRQRFSLALLNTLLVLAIFWLLYRLYNHLIAVTATLLIALDPFLLVESRLFRAEGLTAGLMMVSALLVIYYARQRRWHWLLISGALAGLTMLTRVNALYLFFFTGLVLLAWPVLAGERNWPRLLRQTGRDLAGWSFMAGLFFVALWPALWASPLEGPSKIYHALEPVFASTGRVYKKGVFFQSHLMGEIDPGPAFYLWAGAYRTTPLLWLGLAAGVIALFYQRLKGQTANTATPSASSQTSPISLFRHSPPHLLTSLFILAYLLFYFISINLSATKIDRYLVTMLPGLSILAAVGLAACVRLFPKPHLVQWGLWAGLILAGAWLSLPHHPYYYTYWNPLLGGGPAAVKILPATGRQGVDLALDTLNDMPNAADLKLTGTNLQLDLKLECPVIFGGHCLPPAEFLDSDYFLLSLYEIQNQPPLANLLLLIPDAKQVYTYTKDNIAYTWLYQMPPGLHHVGQWLDRASGSFSGYRLSSPPARLTVTLFWQNGEESGWRFTDSELFVKLMDSAGQVQRTAPARLNPEFEPYLNQPNEALAFTAALTPTDLPVGLYTLGMGLRLQETGQETLNFALPTPPVITLTTGLPADQTDSLSITHRLDQPLDAIGLTLPGYNPVASSPPRYDLYWQVNQPVTQTYQLQATLLNHKGEPVAEWRTPLAPAIKPLSDWLPGEMVKLPLPLELSQALPSDDYRLRLSLWSDTPATDKPLAEADLGLLPAGFSLTPVLPPSPHLLDDLTFGPGVDLPGYGLQARKTESGGSLLVTLYWLNRQPAQPTEAQIQVFDQSGQLIGQQTQPVPVPAHPLTWQNISYYEFPVAANPHSLVIRVKPVNSTVWLTAYRTSASAGTEVRLDNILSLVSLIDE